MIYKNKDITTNINEKTVELGNIEAKFYTEDEGTASIRIFINWNNKPVDLNKINMKPVLSLFMQDGSIFEGEKVEVILAEKGLIQYKIPSNVIKHVGKVNAKLFLVNDNESIHVANFNFEISDSGVEEPVKKELSFNLLDEAIKHIVSANAMELLDDTFKLDVTEGLQAYVKENAELFKGDKGEKLTFEDLTEIDKQELKGEPGQPADNEIVAELIKDDIAPILPEVETARGDYDNLNERLNNSDDKLNNTQRVINIVARGAIGDGTTDNYQIIQDAITEAEIDGSSIFIPSGTFYISKNLETKHMTSYNYRFGIKIYGNGKDSILTRKSGKIPADYTSKEKLPHQATLSLYGSNNIIEDVSINDSQVGVYIGQDPSTNEPSSASMNRFKNIWMEYVGTGLQFTHGAGNHYNVFENFHIIHSQISVDLGVGYFMDKFNNNRNTFSNFRVARTWIGFLLRETDGNFFNNIYAETLQGDGAIGNAPSFLPSELNGKKTFIVALDGQYNTFNNYGAEAVEWYIYSVGFRNSFVNGMTKDDSVATNKVMFPNPARQPLNYMANSTMIAGLTYQPQAGIFYEGSNGIGIQAPYRLFDINYHRQNKSLTQLSSNITGLTSLSSSKAHRVGRKVDWSIYARFIAKFDGNSNQMVKEPIKINLPFTETPETLYTNALTTNLTKPFMVFVGNSNGATEVTQARISTVDEATSYGGYHLIVNPPATGWRTDANVNYLAFDISWNV
ncbi:BppU family phage baseplate upper protein [Staphylococcus saprophyticus]|nr:BppU family phage baseplate upper protein [Staphylococcus saprophyticus]